MMNNNDPQLKNSRMVSNCGTYLAFRSESAQTHSHISMPGVSPISFVEKPKPPQKMHFPSFKGCPSIFLPI